jgi:hypothetical protein
MKMELWIAIWLYFWGSLFLSGVVKDKKGFLNVADYIVSLFWPIIIPLIFVWVFWETLRAVDGMDRRKGDE